MSAVLGVALVVAAAVLVLRPSPPTNAGLTVGYTAPPTRSSAATKTLQVVVVRGGVTGCEATGGCGESNYASVLSFDENWPTTVLETRNSGYAAGATSRPPINFASHLADVYRIRPDLVIVEGSAGDFNSVPSVVQADAASLYEKLRVHLPEAKIVVVGPIWSGVPPSNVRAIERAVATAAKKRTSLFIDPIAQTWFPTTDTALIAPDHISPTDAGHQLIAKKLMAALAAAHIG